MTTSPDTPTETAHVVYIKAYATVVVLGASDYEEALDLACDEINLGGLTLDEASIESELTDAGNIDAAKRHADLTLDAAEYR